MGLENPFFFFRGDMRVCKMAKTFLEKKSHIPELSFCFGPSKAAAGNLLLSALFDDKYSYQPIGVRHALAWHIFV